MRDQTQIDDGHLRLLSVLHFVTAGLAIVGLLFLVGHFMIMNTLIRNPEMWKNQQNGGPQPDQFFAIFQWFYLLMGTFMLLGAVGNLLSGMYMRKKKKLMFSMVVSGFNCLNFPLGTVLGVFTFIVLLRDSVRDAYEH